MMGRQDRDQQQLFQVYLDEMVTWSSAMMAAWFVVML
jgi:hypothetical protein